MTVRVPVSPELLRWACVRNGHEPDAYSARFPKLGAWLSGDAGPTLKQLEAFAAATYTPLGLFFLPEPPEETVPLPDLRAGTGGSLPRPSPNLLDTIFLCQRRQEWFVDYAKATEQSPLDFVGSASVSDDVVPTAAKIRKTLGFTSERRRECKSWTDALRQLIDLADSAGMLVMCSGVVGNNNSRPLDPAEFRGFAIADELAPLIFINGADTKAAQMFTLAHELAHIWTQQSAISDPDAGRSSSNAIERWCNEVAAELLVPLSEFRDVLNPRSEIQVETARLARFFKVSTLVVLRRLHDIGHLSAKEMWKEYHDELERLANFPRSAGGNFYLTQAARVGRRFARALVRSTLEGRTLYRDAFNMLGISKISTFDQFGHSVGVI